MKTVLSVFFSATLFGAAQSSLAAPPKVIKATPDNGAKAVNPGLKMLRIVFDQPMSMSAYSVVGGGPQFPKLVGRPGWENNRSFVCPWQLEPEHEYSLSINSDRFTNFRNAQGEPAVPYPIAFRTGQASTVPLTTPNDLFRRGGLTFVLGTGGDDRADRGIAAQVEFIRSALFPAATVVKDLAIDVAKGAAAWPRNPVVFGGPHVNTLLDRLAPSLPFSMQRGKLKIGDEVFEGDEYRLIAIIPARQPDAKGPGYPEFLLYAGAGSPGVAEINSLHHGEEPILIGDAFGRLLSGEWQQAPGGQLKPFFPAPRARRVAWRTVKRELSSPAGAGSTVQVRFAEQLAPASDEDQTVAACLRGLTQAGRKLELTNPASVTIYIYPDRASKGALTGIQGDGHSDIIAYSVHVIGFDSGRGGGLERLLAHEGTHVLAYQGWGAAGTAFMGEGLAVWASGGYGGDTLDVWKSRLQARIPVLASFLGKGFFQMPEQQSYPLAGLFVEAAVKKIGLAKVRAHLFGATASTWREACSDAGTTPGELEQAWRESLGP